MINEKYWLFLNTLVSNPQSSVTHLSSNSYLILESLEKPCFELCSDAYCNNCNYYYNFQFLQGRKLHTRSCNALGAAEEHSSLQKALPPATCSADLGGGWKPLALLAHGLPVRAAGCINDPPKSEFFQANVSVKMAGLADSTSLPAGTESMPELCNMYIGKIYFELMFYAFGNYHFIVYVYINYCSCFIPFMIWHGHR